MVNLTGEFSTMFYLSQQHLTGHWRVLINDVCVCVLYVWKLRDELWRVRLVLHPSDTVT